MVMVGRIHVSIIIPSSYHVVRYHIWISSH